MPTIIIKQSVRQDAWNWWDASNKISYGVDWKLRINKKLRHKLVNQAKEQSLKFLIPYLKNLYKKERIRLKRREIQNIFHSKQKQIFSRMEKVTGKKIYRKKITCFLTTFPRAPYNYQCSYIWLPIVWPKHTYIKIFAHELLHFQTYAYWQNVCLKKLAKEKFEDLKEALTVILNEEFMDLMVWPDTGYKIHKKLRKELSKFWQKNKSFNELINYGINIISRHKERV